MNANCVDCGASFFRADSESWKVRCLVCWKQAKAVDRSSDRMAAGDQREAWYRRGYEAGRASALARLESEPVKIDKARVRQLLQLCHPDRHGGSDLAQRVTAWLNDVKRSVLT